MVVSDYIDLKIQKGRDSVDVMKALILTPTLVMITHTVREVAIFESSYYASHSYK